MGIREIAGPARIQRNSEKFTRIQAKSGDIQAVAEIPDNCVPVSISTIAAGSGGRLFEGVGQAIVDLDEIG